MRKFGIEDAPEWAPYLAYNGIGLDATNEELIKFFKTGPEDVCRMCPKSKDAYLKDLYNTNWKRNGERVEWEGEAIDLEAFIQKAGAA